MTLARNQLAVLRLFEQTEVEMSAEDIMADRTLELTSSSVYAAIGVLQRRGLLASRWSTKEERPRRFFRITSRGLAELTQLDPA